jgi:TetR/AcrR family transcriptional regulator
MTTATATDIEAPAAILSAATELFAAQGFAGVTIKEISARAKVNSALIYYYYEDKEGLYRAVLRYIIGTISQQVGGAIAVVPSPEEGVRRFVLAQSARFREDRNFAFLVLRELFDGGTIRLEVPMHSVVTNALRPLMELIQAGQKSGAFRADLDPRFAAISTISQVAYFTIAQPIVATLMGHSGTVPPETSRDFGAHAAEWAVRALKA